MLIFCKTIAEISKIKRALVLEGIFSETTVAFQISSIILTLCRLILILIPVNWMHMVGLDDFIQKLFNVELLIIIIL